MQVFVQTSSLWIPIFSYLILGQKLSYKQVILCLISFFGILLIVDPSMIGIGSHESDSTTIYDEKYYFGCCLGMIAGVLLALKTVYTIEGIKEIDTWHNLFYFALGGSLLASLVNIQFDYNNIINLWDFYIVIQITILGLFLHGGMVHFLRLESNATIVGIIINMAILWAFLLDYFLVGNSFNIYNGIGAFIVAACG